MSEFPTGKPHVSYSEVRCWKECPWRHKLLHIEKIDVFKPSPYLDFGTQVHEGCESYLNNGTIPREKLIENIINRGTKQVMVDLSDITNPETFYENGRNISRTDS